LAMAELAAARVEVEAAAAADAARAVAAELEVLCGSSINSSVSADGSTDDELKLAREAAREQAAQWEAAHPSSAVAATQTGADALAALRAGARGGSPDRRVRAGGWVDGDRGLYRWCGSPSSDRYHGHRGIQTVVRDVDPTLGGLPSLRPTTSSGPR
jgi:hypothetical protein